MNRHLVVALSILFILTNQSTRASLCIFGFNQPIIADGRAYAISIGMTQEVVSVDIRRSQVAWRTSLAGGSFGRLYHGAPGEIVAPSADSVMIVDRESGRIKRVVPIVGYACWVSEDGRVFTVDWEDTTVRCYSYVSEKMLWQTSLFAGRNPINADVRGNVVLVTVEPRGQINDIVMGTNVMACLTADRGELVWQVPLPLRADGWADDIHVDSSDDNVVAYHHHTLWLMDKSSGALLVTKGFPQVLDVVRFWSKDRLVAGYRSDDSLTGTVAVLTGANLDVTTEFNVGGTNKYVHSWGLFGDTLDWGHCLVDLVTHNEVQVPFILPDYIVSYSDPPIHDMKVYFGSGRANKQTRLLATQDIRTGACAVLFEEGNAGNLSRQISGHSFTIDVEQPAGGDAQ